MVRLDTHREQFKTTSLDDTDGFRVAVSFEGKWPGPCEISRAEMHKRMDESFRASATVRKVSSPMNDPAGKRETHGETSAGQTTDLIKKDSGLCLETVPSAFDISEMALTSRLQRG